MILKVTVMKHEKLIQFRCDPELVREIDQQADAIGLGRSAMVRMMLLKSLHANRAELLDAGINLEDYAPPTRKRSAKKGKSRGKRSS